MKTYLLIAGEDYYPERGTNNWIDTFNTYEEAEKIVVENKVVVGKDTRFVRTETTHYTIRGVKYDWYEIIDLNKWISR